MGMSAQLLGELLLQKGWINRSQLDAALEEQRRTKEFLGALLVRKGWLREDQFLKALAEQFEMAYANLDEEAIDTALAGRFPPALLKERCCLPLRMAGSEIIVAIANPLDAWAISELQRAAGFRKVQLVLASAAKIDAARVRLERQAMQAISRQVEQRPTTPPPQ